MQEENLIHQFVERNEEAISESKQRYASYCFAIAQNILTDREDAEECLNDALLAAWNSIPPHHPENLKTYLGKLTREISIDRFRKKNAQKRIPSGFVIPFDELDEMIWKSEVAAYVEEAELSSRISLFLRS
ncbi:MAG: RNA polymerase subunit sigma-70, partial [Clostridia bacterium]|nr:RNA polymerase subunit sigma-70 [Clostridia bacterium]